MDFVETEGDTIDAAIANALKLLGVEREKINVEIISEGRKGILGFGAQKAKVRAELRGSSALAKTDATLPAVELSPTPIEASAVAEKAHVALGEILRLMGIKATVQRKPSMSGDETILEIQAENSGLLIGRKGQTLEALQYLVTRIAGERPGSEEPHVVVDIESYRERRRKSLEDMALRLGEKAKRQRKTVTVDALSAADRRIIHAALQDDPWVSTKSLGQGSYRRLLIIPEGDRKRKDEAEPTATEGRGAKSPAKTDKSAASAAADDDEN
ncbi:MAG: RNA-binding cell elongation regulator Jag/EloR [Chloroflexota bacterium]